MQKWKNCFLGPSTPISYPESSGFLVSGWLSAETLRYWNFITAGFSAVKQCKPLQGTQSKNFNFFELARVSPCDQLLVKEPDDSGYEIASTPTLQTRSQCLSSFFPKRESSRVTSGHGRGCIQVVDIVTPIFVLFTLSISN